jgi:hypothetical protein
MQVPFTVHAENMEEFDKKGGGKQKTRRVMLLDASSGSRLSQIIEMNLPPEHPALGVGKQVTIEIDEIAQIFAGRPRIRGRIISPTGK